MNAHGKQTCARKQRYKTRKDAWSGGTYVYIHYGYYVSVYRCRYCDGYHLTKRHGNMFPPAFLENVEKWLGFKIKETDGGRIE